jgi:glycosyltransferase involved in cell wall biosynthesis
MKEPSDLITVASVPTAHSYVEHLAPLGDSAVSRLPDPRPVDAEEGATRWWPPRWLEPHWLAEHVDSVDLLHIHFGFDSIPPERLHEVVRVARDANIPLVFTVHDLHNPHFADSALHLRHLDVLVPAADQLVTLTEGAANVIEERWSVRPSVVPHPHVAPLELIGRPRAASDAFVIGVHAKSFRANLDPLAVLDTVVRTAAEISGARVQVDMDDTAIGSVSHHRLLGYASRGVDVRVHPRFDDDALWEYLRAIDVSVLPYRFGTHSGWLEACYDVGTAVVAPDCGFFADQKPCHDYGFGIDRFDAESLAAAIRAAHDQRHDTATATRTERELERANISAAHHDIYTRALQGCVR